MYIEKIKIGNFGKLSNREFDLSSGINILEGKNESGKSTLCEFIKFVFYGLSNKSAGGEMSERKRHISWKSNDVSGSVTVNDGEKSYRIERSMVAHGAGYKDEITVVDLENGAVMGGIKNPGEYFFGIPEEVFARTVYIRQEDGAYFNGGDIGQAVENIFYSADESINTEKALKKLDEARVMIKHKKNTGRGMLEVLERETEALRGDLERARSTNELVMQNESSLRFTLNAIENNKKDCEKMAGQMRKTELHGLIGKFEEIKKYKDQIENFKRGKQHIIEAMTYNGFFPSSEYGTEVEKAKNDILYLKKEVDTLADISEYGEPADYSRELAEVIRARGGKQGIDNQLDELDNKKKKTLRLGVVLCVVAILFAVVGVLPLKVLAGKNIFLFAACGAALIGGIAAIAVSSRWGKRFNGVFDTFGVEDDAGLFKVIDEIERAEKYEYYRTEMIRRRGVQQKEAENRLNDSIASMIGILDKWGVAPQETDLNTVLQTADSVLSDIKDISKNIELYEREAEKNEAVLKAVESQISVFDEEQIRREYESIDFEIIPENINEIKKRYEFTVKAKDALAAKVNELEKSLVELRARHDDPAEIESRLNIALERAEELKFKHEAYVLAYEKLQNAASNIRNRLAPGLSVAAGRMMDGITDGKYKEIGVSDGLEMTYTFEEEGAVFTKTIDCVSAGTRDIAYVSLRLALAEMFGKNGQRLPVIFDESFSRLDDRRLKNMLMVVNRYAENGAQAIIMTSHDRESGLMESSEGQTRVNHLVL